ncbi:MAG: hypothetical protein ACREXR_23500, partial [Gammaproteobacteria bacterium]
MHRRFQQWCRSEVLRHVLMDLGNALREEGALDELEGFIDATFAPAQGEMRRRPQARGTSAQAGGGRLVTVRAEISGDTSGRGRRRARLLAPLQAVDF